MTPSPSLDLCPPQEATRLGCLWGTIHWPGPHQPPECHGRRGGAAARRGGGPAPRLGSRPACSQPRPEASPHSRSPGATARAQPGRDRQGRRGVCPEGGLAGDAHCPARLPAPSGGPECGQSGPKGKAGRGRLAGCPSPRPAGVRAGPTLAWSAPLSHGCCPWGTWKGWGPRIGTCALVAPVSTTAPQVGWGPGSRGEAAVTSLRPPGLRAPGARPGHSGPGHPHGCQAPLDSRSGQGRPRPAPSRKYTCGALIGRRGSRAHIHQSR